MNRIIMLLFITLFTCLLNSNSVFAEENLDPNASADSDIINASADDIVKDDSRVFHIYEGVDLVSTLKISYGKPRIVIKSVYPQLASDTDEDSISLFNDLSLQIVKDEIAKFTAQVKERAPYQKNMPKNKLSNNLYIDYATSYVKSKNNHIISIRFSIQGFIAGMAHPYHYHRVLNYNVDTKQEIQLNDLFVPGSDYLNVLSHYTRAKLSRRLDNQDMVNKGTEPSAENFAIWNIKPNGLLITFDEYQVAPYVYGAQTVLVPFTALKKIIAPDSFIADCIKHPGRCRNNNVLTGGFIDEASNARHRSFNPIFS